MRELLNDVNFCNLFLQPDSLVFLPKHTCQKESLFAQIILHPQVHSAMYEYYLEYDGYDAI